MDIATPLATPLPEPPLDEPFSEANWRMLIAIMDAVIPSIVRETSASGKNIRLTISDAEFSETAKELSKSSANSLDTAGLEDYFAETASEIPKFVGLLKRTFAFNVRADGMKGLGIVLSTLDTRLGSLLLTGYTIPFHEQPLTIRQEILERWRVSYLRPMNIIFKQMSGLSKALWLKTSPNFRKLSGFPVVPDHYKPGPHFEYDFLQFSAGTESEIIETDVVIVGSGCGGAVAAKNLAEAGYKVMVVDKGYYYPPSHLPMSEEEGGIHLYENGGVDTVDDGSLGLVAGTCWGGGGTINWSASLQTQGFVRKEWAQDRGLTFFETAEYQKCLDRVCERMGVSTEHIKHNHGNKVILEGARKLGYHAQPVPQNTGGAEHYCGHCTLGCGAAQKQGPVVSWLPDAAKAGAKFVEGFQVDHVIFDESTGAKKAVGVKGTWTSRTNKGTVDGPLSGRIVREVIVRAKKVVLSSGSLWSPILLLKSGLKNWQIGRNLYLHPVNMVFGVYKEDVRPWEGGILTSVCTQFEDLDTHGHGVKLEATNMMPSMSLTIMNWRSGKHFKRQALKFRHTNGFIAIARDRDPGQVYPDPVSGKPRFAYTPSVFDRANVMQGVLALAKMCYVTGATEIHVATGGLRPFIRDEESTVDAQDIDPGITDERFKKWLEEVQKAGNNPPGTTFVSAHQMGSNRMSIHEKDGVVDPNGKVWGSEGLYVADASVFPSASGVNPMITVMAISDHISRGIARELEKER